MSDELQDTYQSLTIGFIPKNNRSEHISAGDPGGSCTKEIEVNFYKKAVEIRFGSDVFEIAYGRRRIWCESSSFWKELATFAMTKLKTHKSKLSSRHLARCFLLPQGEADSRSGILNVADPRDAGEFNNDDGAHSGKYFVRYVYVDEDDYTDENVYVIQ